MKPLGPRVFQLVFAAGVVLPFTGCNHQGTVSGKVTLDGVPLPGGVVSVYDVEDQTRTGGINRDELDRFERPYLGLVTGGLDALHLP